MPSALGLVFKCPVILVCPSHFQIFGVSGSKVYRLYASCKHLRQIQIFNCICIIWHLFGLVDHLCRLTVRDLTKMPSGRERRMRTIKYRGWMADVWYSLAPSHPPHHLPCSYQKISWHNHSFQGTKEKGFSF